MLNEIWCCFSVHKFMAKISSFSLCFQIDVKCFLKLSYLTLILTLLFTFYAIVTHTFTHPFVFAISSILGMSPTNNTWVGGTHIPLMVIFNQTINPLWIGRWVQVCIIIPYPKEICKEWTYHLLIFTRAKIEDFQNPLPK